MQGSSEVQFQNLLSDLTDAILADDGSHRAIAAQFDVSRAEIDGLVKLIHGLHRALVGVRPSRRFANHLKEDLMGPNRWGIVSRVRHLPPRVQIVALVTLIAGFMLLSRRRMMGDAVREIEEAPVL